MELLRDHFAFFASDYVEEFDCFMLALHSDMLVKAHLIA